jgi:4-hydroxybenzoate polyprenyltransferase
MSLLRVHFAPISLMVGLVGVVVGADSPTAVGVALGLAICTGGYSVGQVINDYFDREADAINAPDRPFVSGEIEPRVALTLIVGATLAVVVPAVVIVPAAAVWTLVALFGHVLYTLTKRYFAVLGNVVNGLDVAVFVLVGAAAASPDRPWFDVPGPVLVNAGILALGLTAFGKTSYFKDVPGDVAAGYRTIVVVLGPQRARWVVVPFALLGPAIAGAVAILDPNALGSHPTVAFWAFLSLSAAAFGVGLAQLFSEPERKAYEALVWMTRGVVLLALALGAAHDPALFLAVAAPVLGFVELTLRTRRVWRQA